MFVRYYGKLQNFDDVITHGSNICIQGTLCITIYNVRVNNETFFYILNLGRYCHKIWDTYLRSKCPSFDIKMPTENLKVPVLRHFRLVFLILTSTVNS